MGDQVEHAIAAAMSKPGASDVWATAGPDTFDCQESLAVPPENESRRSLPLAAGEKSRRTFSRLAKGVNDAT